MSKEKGLFADPDRFTRQHQEICLWFSERENAKKYIRYMLKEVGTNIHVQMEVPVKSASGFLYGFADIVLLFENENHVHRSVIVEVKSVLTDFGATLRQLRTYREYLPGESSLAIVCGQLGSDADAAVYFGSQNVRLHSVEDIKTTIEEIEKIGDMEPQVPVGRREAALCGMWFSAERSHMDFDFIVYYRDPESGKECSDLISTGNYFHRRQEAKLLSDAFGLLVNWDNPETIPEGSISLPCTVDVVYSVEDSLELVAVQVGDREFGLA